MQSTQLIIMLMSAVAVNSQRPSFAGTRPIGFPELYDLTTKADELGNRFGEGNASTTTQRLPLEALGDKNLVDRLSKLPVDSQPFWFINWQALEAQRKNPQNYPQKPNAFVPIEGSVGTQNQNSEPIPNLNGRIPSVKSRVSDSVTGTPGANSGVRTTEAVFGYADSEIGRVEDYNKGSGNAGVGLVATSESSEQAYKRFENNGTPNTNTVNFGAPDLGLVNVGYSNGPKFVTPFDHTLNTQSGFGGAVPSHFNTEQPNSGIGSANNFNANSGHANFGTNNYAIPNISSGTVKTSNENVTPINIINHTAETVGAPKVNNVVYNSMIKLHNEQPGKHGLPSNKSFNNHDSTLEVKRTDNPDKSWSSNWKYTWMDTYGYENHFTIPPQPIQLNGGR